MDIKGNKKTSTPKSTKPLTWDNWNPNASKQSAERLEKLDEISEKLTDNIVITIEQFIHLIKYGIPAYSKSEHSRAVSVKMPPVMVDILDGFTENNKLLVRDRSNLIRTCIIIGVQVLAKVFYDKPKDMEDIKSALEIIERIGKVLRKKEMDNDFNTIKKDTLDSHLTVEEKIQITQEIQKVQEIVSKL